MPFYDDMHIDGHVNNSDVWDDTVIMHEWTHFADDKWGCDDNPGGNHTAGGHYNTRLAWGEGFPDFYQSVVRSARGDANGEWYLDVDGLGGCFVCIDFENVDTLHPDRVGDDNETAVAATLWDLYDTSNEGQDQVTLAEGFPLIQKVFVEPPFAKHLVPAPPPQTGQITVHEKCDLRGYFKSWAAIGAPTDAAVAAAITQNTAIAAIFGLAASEDRAASAHGGHCRYGWRERDS